MVTNSIVQVPRVAQPPLPSLEAPSVLRPKLATPLADRFVGHGDPPLGQEVFDVAEAETESVVEPHGVTGDFWGESVSVVAGRVRVHCRSLPLTGSI